MLKPIRVEFNPDDYEDLYEESINESYGEFMNMNASYILKECDPTAYRCGLLDFADSYGSDKYECPICGREHEDEDDALYCCQEEDNETEKEEDGI